MLKAYFATQEKSLMTTKYTKDLIFSNGSIVHFSLPRKVINKSHSVLVTCGSCQNQRYCQVTTAKNSKYQGLCISCSNRKIARSASRHHNWNGGHTLSKEGYVYIHFSHIKDEHRHIVKPMLTRCSYVLEHRYVIAKAINRPLLKSEHVHHLNGIKNDNRLCNLQLVTPNEHPAENKAMFDRLKAEIKRLQDLLNLHSISY